MTRTATDGCPRESQPGSLVRSTVQYCKQSPRILLYGLPLQGADHIVTKPSEPFFGSLFATVWCLGLNSLVPF